MTDRDVVGRAATLMGCSIRLTLKQSPDTSTWHAEIQGARAADIMRELLPYMGARRSAKIAEVLATTLVAKTFGPGPAISRPPGIATPALCA